MKNQYTISNFLSDILYKEIDEVDYDFFYQILIIVESNYHNPNFSVADMASHMKTNRINIFRKLKEMIGLNASSLIRIYRLHKARELILNSSINLCAVASKSGFSNASYFTQCFKKYFGMIPSVYQQKYKAKVCIEEIFIKKNLIDY